MKQAIPSLLGLIVLAAATSASAGEMPAFTPNRLTIEWSQAGSYSGVRLADQFAITSGRWLAVRVGASEARASSLGTDGRVGLTVSGSAGLAVPFFTVGGQGVTYLFFDAVVTGYGTDDAVVAFDGFEFDGVGMGAESGFGLDLVAGPDHIPGLPRHFLVEAGAVFAPPLDSEGSDTPTYPGSLATGDATVFINVGIGW